MAAPKLAQLKVKLFTDGADKAQIVEMAKQPWIAGLYDQSVAAQEGRRERLCGLWPRSGRCGARPAYFVRSVFRRHPRDGCAGACHHHLGQECLRQAAGDDHARRAFVRCGARAFARRRQDQHDRDLSRPSRSRVPSRRSMAARRHACRYSPAGLPTSASTIGRSCRTRSRVRARRAMSRSSGLPRAKSSTSWKPTRWVATSSPRRPTCSKNFPRSAPRSAAELSLGAVKSFRDDAVAAGLQTRCSGLARGGISAHSAYRQGKKLSACNALNQNVFAVDSERLSPAPRHRARG